MDAENKTHPARARTTSAICGVPRDPLRAPPPPFTVATRLEGRTAIVTLRGELDMASTEVLADSLVGIALIVEELVLDVAELEFIDARGLRTIADAARQMLAHGGSASIRSPSARIERALELLDFKQAAARQPGARL